MAEQSSGGAICAYVLNRAAPFAHFVSFGKAALHRGEVNMQVKVLQAFRVAAGAMCVAAALSGCFNSDSSPPNNAGTIAFDDGANVAVTKGSAREVVLALKNSNGVAGQTVRIASSDTSVADVSPASCTLSSSSDASSKCALKVHGKSKGIAVLTAQSVGYPDTPLSASVGDAVNYGLLAVANSAGTFVTTGPVSVSYTATGTAPYQTTLTAQLSGSSGITTASSALINFSSTTGVVFNPPQCPVTSAAPTCTTTASVPAGQSSIAVNVVGAILAQNTYAGITINAGPSATPGYGTIAISTQAGNNVPNGMKAPLFVNWTNAGTADAVNVTLSIVGAGVSFYSYSAGNNTTMNTSQTQTCTLTNTGVSATSQLNCGLGLVGSATSGFVTINASATATSTNQYTIAPLIVGAVAPEPTRRSITFTNNSSKTIYVGITGGAANSYVSASASTVPPGTPSANLKPGAGSLCGLSNPQAACPIGTACIQGGSSPNSNFMSSPFYCYYDQNTPSNGHQLAAGAATVLAVSGSSISYSGIIWSGNFYARTGCDSSTGLCENATCVGAAGGLACGPGTGPSPGTNTLAELTFQAYPATDFYDVSIINGVNFATQFGPTNIAPSTTNAYSCGTAGSLTAQNGGCMSGSVAGLPAASWQMTPTKAASFPPGVTLTGDASSYYRAVNPSTAPGKSCTMNSDCTTGTDTTCGYAMSSVATGSQFSFSSSSRTCGKPVAWLTADGIWGLNSTASNAAPLAFATSWSNGSGGTVSVGDLQLCINNTYSAYVANGTSTSSPAFPIQAVALACGGVMWGATESPGPTKNPLTNIGLNLTTPSQPVQTANANWLSYVLPTITWLKQACPTCYTYPFDDMTSTFTCADTTRTASPAYGVTFSDTQ